MAPDKSHVGGGLPARLHERQRPREARSRRGSHQQSGSHCCMGCELAFYSFVTIAAPSQAGLHEGSLLARGCVRTMAIFALQAEPMRQARGPATKASQTRPIRPGAPPHTQQGSPAALRGVPHAAGRAGPTTTLREGNHAHWGHFPSPDATEERPLKTRHAKVAIHR